MKKNTETCYSYRTIEIFIETIREDFTKFLQDQNEQFYKDLIRRLSNEINNS